MSAVLIVNGSPPDRDRFRTLLSRAGFQVHEESMGGAATARAQELLPHVIVLDAHLPDIDGLSVCRVLRSTPACASLPILLLTPSDDGDIALAGLEAGADDYVTKDAAAAIVLARVRRLVRYRQMASVVALNEGLVQVGRLLAGVIHEIRGPLSVIRGNAELAKLELGEGHSGQQWIDPIIRNCRLLQARLEYLMAAVRGGPQALRLLDVPPLVQEAADLFRKGSDPRAGVVEVVTQFEDDLPPILGDAGRLVQVFLNLLNNAYEAILGAGDRGRVTIRAAHLRDEEGDWVRVEVADDGPGIPEPYLGRIFEPFFTTKAEGSGYGLYLSAEILREQGGRLTACNGDHGGACLRVWLPVAAVPAPL